MDDGNAYYWAGGQKVPLHRTTDVVVDLSSVGGALAGQELETLRGRARSLGSSMLMVAQSEVSTALGAEGATMPGVHPVFRSDDGALVVVLPEVRVEAGDPGALDEVGRSLSGAHVVEQTEERLVLAPDSGRGEDALLLANSLAESSRLEVSQARFLRVVPRPEPG